MKLTVNRTTLEPTYTIGKLFVNGEYFCDTLEDTVRDKNKDGKLDEKKVFGKTAIPYGTYKVELRYSPHFKRIMPHIMNVPDFEGVLIHSGNTPEDTEGCLLVGKNTIKGEITHSREIFNSLFPMIEAAIKKGDEVTITYT